MRLVANEVQGLVIDYQTRLMPVIHDQAAILAKSVMLIKGLAALDVPMLVSEQYPRGLGHTVEEVAAITSSLPCFAKTSFSAVDDEAISAALASAKRRTVVVCGVEAHVCVLQSIIDLQQAGYQVVLPVDCVGSRQEADKTWAIERAKQEGACITTAEALLFELTRSAGHPAFKTISALVK